MRLISLSSIPLFLNGSSISCQDALERHITLVVLVSFSILGGMLPSPGALLLYNFPHVVRSSSGMDPSRLPKIVLTNLLTLFWHKCISVHYSIMSKFPCPSFFRTSKFWQLFSVVLGFFYIVLEFQKLICKNYRKKLFWPAPPVN